MNIQNLLERGFWSGYAESALQIGDVLVCFATVAVLCAYIFFVYRSLTKKTFYNQSFNISLTVLALIIAGIILTVQSNIVISLGMVGALSIVRYRTAIKDPMDLVFLFWSISVGIICGAGLSLIAVILSLVATAGIAVFSRVSLPRPAMILLVKTKDYRDETVILDGVKKYCSTYAVKSRNMTKDFLDMAIEVSSEKQGELIRGLVEIPSVLSASLVSHDGEVTL